MPSELQGFPCKAGTGAVPAELPQKTRTRERSIPALFYQQGESEKNTEEEHAHKVRYCLMTKGCPPCGFCASEPHPPADAGRKLRNKTVNRNSKRKTSKAETHLVYRHERPWRDHGQDLHIAVLGVHSLTPKVGTRIILVVKYFEYHPSKKL